MLRDFFSSKVLESIVLDGTSFTVKHTLKKNMKRIILRVEKKNQIRISSSKVSQKRLVAFINENKRWIMQRQAQIKDPFEEGSLFFYLKRGYRIKHHDEAFCINGETAFLNPLKPKAQSDEFYKRSAQDFLPSRVSYWQEKMDVEYKALKFRLAKRRWGSCNSLGIVTLNPYMMKLDHEMIDYIIVHELAHLMHLNHSKAFYKLVGQYIPNYKTIEKEINSLNLG